MGGEIDGEEAIREETEDDEQELRMILLFLSCLPPSGSDGFYTYTSSGPRRQQSYTGSRPKTQVNTAQSVKPT